MAPDATTVVITTSSPGLALVCLAASRVEEGSAAVLTTPGAAVGDGAPGLSADLVAAIALTGARQVHVLGHVDDPAYAMGSPGVGRAALEAGIDLDRAIGPRFLTPGLHGNARDTVRHAVTALAGLSWLPAGLTVSGTVFDDDLRADTVAIEIVSGEAARGDAAPDGVAPLDRARLVSRQVPGEERILDGEPVAVQGFTLERLPDDLLDGEAAALFASPDPAEPPASPGPVDGSQVLVDMTPAGGEVTLGALAPGGGVSRTSGGEVTLGALALGGPGDDAVAAAGRAAGSTAATGGTAPGSTTATGETELGPMRLDASAPEAAGPLISDALQAPADRTGDALALTSTAEAIPRPASAAGDAGLGDAPARLDGDPDDDLLERWLARDPVVPLAPDVDDAPWERRATTPREDAPSAASAERVADGSRRPPPPRPPTPEVGDRITAAADILHRFVLRDCGTHALTRDMRRLHRVGAGPEPIMDELLTLVKQRAGDSPEVRAAYGTLEMARTVLTRGQILDLLASVVRDDG